MTPKLAILIPTLTKRRIKYGMLRADLDKQIRDNRLGGKVVILVNEDQGQKTIGKKRNELLEEAIKIGAEYIQFIDDDDRVHYNFIKIEWEALKSSPDCVELQGIITTNQYDPHKFIHSIRYKHYYEDKGVYYRPPNHLNCIRLDLVKDIKFPDINFSEDTSWAMKVCDLGRLKTMEPVPEPIYYYDYVTNK